MSTWPEGLPDLLDEPDTAYIELDSQKYDAEKGLLELYRNFVSEMLRMSLAGIAVLGFLIEFKGADSLTFLVKACGIVSLGSFALSAILALLFLYASAEGYRYYIAGLRAEQYNKDFSPEKYLSKRREFVDKCAQSKEKGAKLLAVGILFMGIGIILAL